MNSERMPQHVAIIMDGNGRWAREKGLTRVEGHGHGAKRVEEIVQAASDLGIPYLTLYSFSKENWTRPQQEVSFIMNLLAEQLEKKLDNLHAKNVVFNTIGNIADLPQGVAKKVYEAMEKTKDNTGLTLTCAFSYSSRLEMVGACKKIAERVRAGEVKVEAIDEALFSDHLDTAGLPDPDLLIRTSGEMRISNFLLWQISYSEIYVTSKYWPDFDRNEFQKAIEDYQKRERRFGNISAQKANGS